METGIFHMEKMWKKGGEQILFDTKADGLHIQVVDKAERRELRFGNNVVQSAISLICPELLVLKYTRYMMIGFILKPEACSILHIGLGAGSMPGFIYKYFPYTQQDVIEQSKTIETIAYRFFDFPQTPRIKVRIIEAEKAFQQHNQQYDLIFFDAFDAHGTPKHLTNPDFLENLKNCIKPDGWVVGNMWTSEVMFSKQRKYWQQVFPQVVQAHTQPVGNVVLFGRKIFEKLDPRKLHQNAQNLQADIPLDFVQLLKEMLKSPQAKNPNFYV